MRTKISKITEAHLDTTITVCGWVTKTHTPKKVVFVWLADDATSRLEPLQIVFGISDKTRYKDLEVVKKISKGYSISVTGTLIKSLGKGQLYELQATSYEVIGSVGHQATYPLMLEDYPMDYYRTSALEHLECLAPVKSAIYKIRSILSEASDYYFRSREFTKVHMPMITFSECESGCGVFTVTSFCKTGQVSDFPTKKDVLPAQIDFSKDFFSKKSCLTVSSQLELECSLPLGDVYCETRAARCEESMTSRHLCEFTMIEFESPFITSAVDIIDRAEAYVRFMFTRALESCEKELAYLSKKFSTDLKTRLTQYLEKPFPRISHADAVTLMLEQPAETFSTLPSYSDDLSTEHEKWLSETHFKTGVFVCKYPKAVKAFYMPVVQETPEESHGVEHVDSFDFLIDGLELIGGSARIWRLEELESRITELGLDRKPLEFYLGLRRDGSAKSGGLGLGFDRLVKVVTGAPSIKDCVQFPRYVGCA